VLTNSVPVAAELSGRGQVELLLCGGPARPGDGACYGAHAEAFFTGVHAGKAFVGAGGVHPEAGLTDYYAHRAAPGGPARPSGRAWTAYPVVCMAR
jgi:DeoR family transcriptional regulator, fructose operon transcriptional repressor